LRRWQLWKFPFLVRMEVFPKFNEALNAFEHFYDPPPRLMFG